ncbi:hypothetical protein V202x_48500 [Gimesia aquarii]|uniref:Uncharacterized protein n=1 Tax=Gimesia aquarii TaxID=2527964 RepID=A0A517X1Q6_9PLAN|nr:hypothetical protein V202x_48500 [Gimesia aquarii]
MEPRKFIFKNTLSPGDIVMLTAGKKGLILKDLTP